MRRLCQLADGWGRRRPPVLAATLVCLGMAATAPAFDGKYFPATFCRAVPDPNDKNGAMATYQEDGSVTNQDAQQRLQLVCPIIRDNTQNLGGWQEVKIGFIDRSPGDAIKCAAYSRDQAGNEVGSTDDSEDSNLAVWAPMVLPAPANGSIVNGYYHLRCLVPRLSHDGASGIAYYRIQEP